MQKSKYHTVGVMSGTSLDGIDLVFSTLHYNSAWSYTIHYAETVSYPSFWVDILANLTELRRDNLKKIDNAYTNYLAATINAFISKNNLKGRVDFICSHGHTALHQPANNLTYQIGNLSKLAGLTKCDVICDFRTQDVELGGQGAPLVPIGDKLLFTDFYFCLNLGGFANVSFSEAGMRKAFDICPVNSVLNALSKSLGYAFDAFGELAAQGHINIEILEALNALPFYSKTPPKSLGIEWVNQCVSPILSQYTISVYDKLRTVIEHISIQISKCLNHIVQTQNVLLTGGGAYNRFLVQTLQTKTHHKIIVPNSALVEYKEALIFSLLGVLKFRNEINCLKSVTGAIKDHSSGKIFNYKK